MTAEHIFPDSEPADPLQPGDHLEAVLSHHGKLQKYLFRADKSFHDHLIEISTFSDTQEAAALVSKDRNFSFEAIPDALKGERGKHYMKIVGALGAAAASGATAYWIIHRRQ